ncbi:hypothetical protein CRENBAI_005707 [Crenichthys baileyi]|uniref:Uncharacterized protein n=1 Tax=Crenichthys baileyi TaxID=28760 RepID=A0AAV9RGE9_9TELE
MDGRVCVFELNVVGSVYGEVGERGNDCKAVVYHAMSASQLRHALTYGVCAKIKNTVAYKAFTKIPRWCGLFCLQITVLSLHLFPKVNQICAKRGSFLLFCKLCWI